MKKQIILIALLVVVALTAACSEKTNEQNTSALTGKSSDVESDHDINYYLSMDEEYVDLDHTMLEMRVEDNAVYLQESDMTDATYGMCMTFETDALEKLQSVLYYNGALVCAVAYYDYPNKKSLTYYDSYYSESEGDWDGNASYIKEETTYYENGQVQHRVLRDVEGETVFVVSEESYDENGKLVSVDE